MQSKKLVIATVTLLAIIGGALVFSVVRNKNSNNGVKSVATLKSVSSEQVGMSVERGATLTPTATDDKGERKELWRFVQPAGSQQQFIVSSYYEQGASLKKLTSVTKMPLKEAVLDNVSRQLPQQYPGYKKINEKDLTVNGTQATEIIFEYVSEGVEVKQRLLLLFKSSDTVVYIRGQAKASEYDQINGRYFEPLFASAEFR